MKSNEFTDKQKSQWIEEVKDDRGYAVVGCDLHSYYPGKLGINPAIAGCTSCAEADIRYRLGKMPPHEREKYLLDMYEWARKMDEAISRGFTFQIFDKPIISTEKSN